MNKLSVLLLSVACLATPTGEAFAAGPANIGGLTGRLESITCRQAYVMPYDWAVAHFNDTVQKHCAGLPVPDKFEACRRAVIKKFSKFQSNALFRGKANTGLTTFQMKITDGLATVLSTTRIGHHGDGAYGETFLSFTPPGTPGGDSTIETSALLPPSSSRVQELIAPILRRAPARSEVYFFENGCSLAWGPSTP